MPAISIAHADGVAVAIAARNPSARVGIDLEPIADRPEGFEAAAFTQRERSLLDRCPAADRDEWITRFWCAKEAAAKATGIGLADGPSGAEVVGSDTTTGTIHVRIAREPNTTDKPLRVATARRAEYAWAWTLEEGAES